MSWQAIGFWVLVGLNAAYGYVLWITTATFRARASAILTRMEDALLVETHTPYTSTPGVQTPAPPKPANPLCPHCSSPRMAAAAEATMNGQKLEGLMVVNIGPLDMSKPVQALACLSCGKTSKIKGPAAEESGGSEPYFPSA